MRITRPAQFLGMKHLPDVMQRRAHQHNLSIILQARQPLVKPAADTERRVMDDPQMKHEPCWGVQFLAQGFCPNR